MCILSLLCTETELTASDVIFQAAEDNSPRSVEAGYQMGGNLQSVRQAVTHRKVS